MMADPKRIAIDDFRPVARVADIERHLLAKSDFDARLHRTRPEGRVER